jgi:flagellar hook-length control protein FliK
MSEVNFQNNIAKVSGVKDGIQSKSNKNTDSTFKSILEGVSSETSSAGKKSLATGKNAVNDNRIETANSDKVKALNDSPAEIKNSNEAKAMEDKKTENVDNCEAESTNNKTNEVTEGNKVEVINDSKASIKLSNEELSELEAFISKLSFLSDDKIGTEDKSKLKLDDVVDLIKMNLVKISDALTELKNKNMETVSGNSEIQPSQASLDLINELSKLQNQIADMISALNTANTAADTQVNDETKDALNVDLSEHSMNAEKYDTKDSNILLELCGMASILSQVAVIKAEQIENVDNKTKVQDNESFKEIQALNKSLATIKELLKNSNQISPENKKNYLNLAQIAENIISSKSLSESNVSINSNIEVMPEARKVVSEILKMMTNNSEDSNVVSSSDSEIEMLINKFIGQADELGQKLKAYNAVNEKEVSVSVAKAQIGTNVLNNTVNIPNKQINEVKRKLEDGDAVFDKEQNKFVIFEEKPDTSLKKVVETQSKTAANGEKIDSSSLEKENKLLLKLASEDKNSSKDDMSSKIARVTNLATSLQAEKSLPVELSEKMPVVNRQTFNNDLIKSMKYMELNDVKELTVKVMPKELGELFIKITREGEVVKAQITATNKEAYNVLNSNLSDITKQLSEQNIKIHSFNVEIFNGDSSFYNQNSKNENGNSQSKRKNDFGNLEVEEISNSEDTLKEFNNVNALA